MASILLDEVSCITVYSVFPQLVASLKISSAHNYRLMSLFDSIQVNPEGCA